MSRVRRGGEERRGGNAIFRKQAGKSSPAGDI